MKPKFLLPLALAVGCGLIATVGVSQLVDQNGRAPTLETAPIYVALHNINVGDPIDGSMVSLQEWPKDKIPPGSITDLEDLEGRRPRTNIIAGETILEAKLLGDNEIADPITQIADGMRLVTIAVDAEKSAAGLLSPGDRVDVQWYANRDERNGVARATTRIILQDVRVFAIEQAVQRAAEGGDARNIPRTVSLEVTPIQAARIDLASKHGELSLIPRNPSDNVAALVAEVTLDELLSGKTEKNSREREQGIGAEQPVREQTAAGSAGKGKGFFDDLASPITGAGAANPPFEMEIIRASERTTMEFDAKTGKPLTANPESEQSFGSRESEGSGSKPGSGSKGSDSVDGDFPIDFDEE